MNYYHCIKDKRNVIVCHEFSRTRAGYFKGNIYTSFRQDTEVVFSHSLRERDCYLPLICDLPISSVRTFRP